MTEFAQALTCGAADVLAERRRQIDEEGWTQEYDAQYPPGMLSDAGATYALWAGFMRPVPPQSWPKIGDWPKWWKQKDQRRDLVRAAALIIAEIDLLDNRTKPNAS